MNDVTYTNANEKKVICGIQSATGALANGVIGMQTLTDIAIKLCPEVFPITCKLYNAPTIISKDVIVCDPNSSVKPYENSISGSFTYPSSDKPCSILINKGKDIFSSACHAWLGKPESVLYRTKSGSFGIKRCLSTSDLPNREMIVWAVGGLGLLDYFNPDAEGFSGAYADVLRKTNHTVLGIRNGMCYLQYFANMTGAQINAACRDKMHFDFAIMLDGGHIAAINGTESFAEINMSQYQGYIIQGV